MTEAAIVIRREVDLRSTYGEYRQDLRVDFWFACAYCSIAETEAQGIGFEIDHYVPVSHDKSQEHAYRNLMWSCSKCNNYKTDYFPSDEQRARGYYVLRPDEENPRNHYDLRGVVLVPMTPTGEFNIDWLSLNRMYLVKLRGIREKIWGARAIIANGLAEIVAMRLDDFHQVHRATLMRLQRTLLTQGGELDENLREFIEQTSRSAALDIDTTRADESTIRRRYLREEKAIVPGVTGVTIPKPRRRQR